MSSRFLPRKEIACSADRVDSPPCWFTKSPTPLDTFSSLRKPLPSSNPRWRSLDQDALAHQNTPELQAILYSINLLVGVHNRIYFLQRPKEAATFCKHSHAVRLLAIYNPNPNPKCSQYENSSRDRTLADFNSTETEN